MIVNDQSRNTNENQKTRFDSKNLESSKSQISGESEPDTMDDIFAGNSGDNPKRATAKSFMKKRDNRKFTSKNQGPLQSSYKGGKVESILEGQQMSESELMLKGLRDNHLTVSQMEAGEARQKLLDVAQTAIDEKNAAQKQVNKLKTRQRQGKVKLGASEDMTQALHKKLLQREEAAQLQKQLLRQKDLELEEMKLALEESMSGAKNVHYQMKRLKEANHVLERKLRAEQAERMSMSNASFVSQAGLGGLAGKGAQKDVLSRSIMEQHNAGGNTSIMDIMSGYNMPMNTRELNNRSMSMNKGQ